MNGIKTLLIMATAALYSMSLSITGQAAQPPATNLILWLKADGGVTAADGQNVTAWADQAGGVLNSGASIGAPQLTETDFPNGPHPVIRLDGNDAFILDGADDLALQDLSIYLVVSADTTVRSQIFIADFLWTGAAGSGWGLGMSDTTDGLIKFVTFHGADPADALEPAAPLEHLVPTLVTATITGGAKRLFINGTLDGTVDGLTPMGYAGGSVKLNAGRLPYETGAQYQVGDIAEILVYSSVSDAQRTAVEAYLNGKYFNPLTGSAVIIDQPKDQRVAELQPVSFSVSADGATPLSFQWFKGGTEIPGATKRIYTITSATRNDAGVYHVVVSNTQGSMVSSNALLAIDRDETAPTLISAERHVTENTKVIVVFSEAVQAETATVAANYQISSGVNVSQAAMGENAKTVVLTTSPIPFGPDYVLTVNGVQDLVGNPVAPQSQVALIVQSPALPVPARDLKLWLRADLGVAVDEVGIATNWSDQIGPLRSDGVEVGEPVLLPVDFPNGSHPVVHFDGSSGFNLAESGDLRLTNLTIYVVASLTEDQQSKAIFSNLANPLAGFALGISDEELNRLKWFTVPNHTLKPEAGADWIINTPYLLTATFNSVGGEKRLFVNGAQVASATGQQLSYQSFGSSETRASVGYLTVFNAQYFIGDIAEILVYGAVAEAQRTAVESYLREKYITVGSGRPVITRAPLSQEVAEFGTLNVEVAATGEPPLSYQWLRNGATIDGATSPVYTIARVTRADQGARFSVQVSNSQGTVTSAEAVLTVVLDTSPPTLSSAKRDVDDATKVTVSFSEALTASTATAPSSYAVDHGVTVSGAVVVSPTTVTLTTSPLSAGGTYSLTVTGVQDAAGNAIGANATIPIQVPAEDLRPPVENLALWLAADARVITSDGHSVTSWTSRETATPNTGTPVGSPQLADAVFPTGSHAVIRLDGNDGFNLDNDSELALPDLSIYAVASIDAKVKSQTVVADFFWVAPSNNGQGWGLGMSDTTDGAIKWVTFHAAPPWDSLEPKSSLSDGVPSLITATYFGGATRVWVNGGLQASADNIQPIDYSAGDVQLAVGMLPYGEGAQFLRGDLAELLIYSSVSDAQRQAVETYLNKRYFLGGPVEPPILSFSREGSNLVLSWSGTATLQSANEITGAWQDITSARSPYPVNLTTACQFFRLKR